MYIKRQIFGRDIYPLSFINIAWILWKLLRKRGGGGRGEGGGGNHLPVWIGLNILFSGILHDNVIFTCCLTVKDCFVRVTCKIRINNTLLMSNINKCHAESRHYCMVTERGQINKTKLFFNFVLLLLRIAKEDRMNGRTSERSERVSLLLFKKNE